MMRKLIELKKIELRVLIMERTLLHEWESHTKKDRGTRRYRNSQIPHPTGEDWNDWWRTRPR